jgi:CDP-diacylglycerol---serine O-phosphatidyltransferase
LENPFAPFDPDGSQPVASASDDNRGARLNEVPLRKLIPNVITVLAICAGISGIRLAYEGRFELAVGMVLLAAFLDGIDGRIARLIKGETRFGAEMDSLADIVNFGVAPALVLHAYVLHEVKTFGWVVALAYVIGCALRLARFNVLNIGVKDVSWRREYFVGVPAPMGAGLVFLPLNWVFQAGSGLRCLRRCTPVLSRFFSSAGCRFGRANHSRSGVNPL